MGQATLDEELLDDTTARGVPASAEELLARVSRRDEHALAELYDRFGAVAYGLAFRILRDREYAEDAVQEAFVALWRNAGSYATGRGSARTWILTLVHRRAVDRVRREQRHAPPADPSTFVEPAFEAPSSFDGLQVRKALLRLSVDERRMVALAYYGGLTQSQVAVELGLPLGTVKSGTARALTRLASFLDEAPLA